MSGWDAWLDLPTSAHLLALRALERPDFAAYTFLQDGEGSPDSVTYGALDAQARSIAAHLQREGAPGDRAVLAYPPGLEFAAAFFGCLYAGVVAVPVPPPLGAKGAGRLRQIFQDCAPRFALGTEAAIAPLREGAPGVPVVWLVHETLLDAAEKWTEPVIGQDALAFLQYTSGSTSAPRGVMIDHGNMLANMAAAAYGLGIHGGDHFVSWLPHFHDMGLAQGLLVPLYAGCRSTVFAPHHFLQKPSRWVSALSSCRATHSGAPNFAYDLCVRKTSPADRAGLDLSALRVVMTGAEPIRPATVEAFLDAFGPSGLRREAVMPAYGMAETMVAVALERHDAAYRTVSAGAKAHVGCGPPLPGLSAIIVDPETLTPAADAQIGEIWIQGTSVAKGYWRRPEDTASVFGARLANGDGPFLRTGDLGFMADGDIFVAGRLKDLIIVHGRNCYPQDIELAAESAHDAIRPGCAAAFAVDADDADDAERVVVVCEAAEREDLDLAAVCGAVRAAVAQEMDIEIGAVALIRSGSIPKTSSGKIQRRHTRALYLEGGLTLLHSERFAPADSAAAPLPPPGFGAIRSFLRERVAARAGVAAESVDTRTPFHAYGLGSLAIVEISKALQDWLGRPLSPALAYSYPTIDALARHLSQGEACAGEAQGREPGEPIAIVGMACRFPGAPDLDAYWSLLAEGREAIGEVPPWRWDPEAYCDPEMAAPFRMRTNRGGFLDEIRDFDAAFFGIPPREAAMMDPQQRLLLEIAWEAFEHAAIAPSSLAGTNTGVYVGVGPVDFASLNLNFRVHPDAYGGTGNAASIAANRLSYIFDLQGPSAAVDTACSSALVAVHQACQALRSRECDAAFAAAVNALVSPMPFFVLSEAGMLSPGGRCKAFDASADGYVRSEGCGGVVLKRLSDAEAAGDRILAVIRGTAINHVGRSNGLTAPSSRAQRAVIEAALRDARVDGASIGYVEAHGTGTSLGDPIEMEALRAVLLPNRPDGSACWVGSAKTNVGHLESAAGMAGLIKAVLSLEKGWIPAHLHLETPNPLLGIEGTAIRIPTEGRPWPAADGPRFAGVSAFGFGGANGHAVLASYDAPEPYAESDGPGPHILTLSAKTETALRELAARYGEHIAARSAPIEALCAVANAGRSHHPCRGAVAASDRETLVDALRALSAGGTHPALHTGRAATGASPRIAMLFTGQGAQFPGMGRGLYESDPEFRATIDRADALLADQLEHRLLDVLYGGRGALLNQTAYTQPALFALEYALAEYWRVRGLRPDAVLGHSVGEFAAACVAGAFGFDDGLALVAARGRLIQSLPAGGAMAAVFAPRADVESWLEPYAGRLVVATVNGPELIVVSGAGAALDDLLASLAEKAVRASRLDVSHAFHSPLMDPVLDAFEAAAAALVHRPLDTALVSNVTGEILPVGHTLDAAYWRRHLREAVLFGKGMEALAASGCDLYLEAGPSNTLLAMGRRAVDAPAAAWLPSLPAKNDGAAGTSETAAALYVRGAAIRWDGFHRGRSDKRATLPSYPFERKRHWIVPHHKGYVWRADGSDAAGEQRSGDAAVHAAPRYALEWRPAAVPAPSSGPLVVFADNAGILDGLARHAACTGRTTLVIRRGAAFHESPGDITVRSDRMEDMERCIAAVAALAPCAAVYGWPLDHAAADGAEAMAAPLAAAAHMFGRLCSEAAIPFWVVTRRGAAAGGGAVNPSQAAYWGLFRTAALEHGNAAAGLVDIDEPSGALWEGFAERVASSGPERQWAYRSGAGWLAARLTPADAPSEAAFRCRPDGAYLLTGGFGALGMHTAKWLIDRGARHLLLLARHAPPARSEWAALAESDPMHRRIEAVRELERLGASVRWASADAGDMAALEAILDTHRREAHPPIRGVFHLAGALDDRSLTALDAAAFERVWKPKAEGAWNLHRAFTGEPLDCFVLFSSAASLLGSAGQGNYAAANAYLDGLAALRASLGLPGLSVNWGPWAEGGMADDADRGGRMARRGIRLLDPAAALAALGDAMARDAAAQTGVFDMDWAALAGQFGGGGFFEHVAGSTGGVSPEADLAALLDADSESRGGLMLGYVRSRVAEALGEAAENIDIDLGLVHLGLDSIMMLDIVRVIGRDLGVRIHVRELFDHDSVSAFSAYVATELDILQGRRRGAEAPPEGFLAATYGAAGGHGVYKPIAAKNPSCVFVLSAPRSGSTLLRVMLAGHPRLFSPPELHLLHFQGMAGRAALFGLGQDLGAGLQRAFAELRGISEDEADALVQRMTEDDTPIQEVYRLLQADAAPKTLVDKSPTYGGRAETLRRAEEMFDGAKYIYLYRHPYSVIESYVRNRTGRMFDFGHADPFLLAQEVWTVNNRNIREFTETVDPSRVFAVRYEDMVREPDGTMEAMCAFLDLPFDASVVAPYDGARMTDGGGDRSRMVGDPNFWKHEGIDASLAEVWRAIELPGLLGEAAQREARLLGYELPREDGGEAGVSGGAGVFEDLRL